ncbi:MAG TPA: outer membrane beta-barrel protein [Fibrobacteria bacterium]|nr:outer membrane beta-barrel protein [Fibrobacteria bacterium]
MKRTISLIAFATMAAMAGPFKVGGDASGALFIPSFDPSTGITTEIGFGGKIAPAVEYAINDQFSFRGNVGYEYATYGGKQDFMGSTITDDATSQFLTLDLAAQYAFIPQAYAAIGVGYDINLSSKIKESATGFADTTFSMSGKKNPFFVTVGLGYKVTPDIAITAGYQFPITNVDEDTGDNGNGTTTTQKVNFQTITLGIRYDYGL